MTYINNTIMLIEEVAGNMSDKHHSNVQDTKIWSSLRTHIMSRREKNKQAEVNAEVLRKKKCVEYQKMQENKLSLAQINGRLSQLRDKRDELEEEKRVLINQTQTTNNIMVTALVVPKSEPNCESVSNKLVSNNSIINAVSSNHRSSTLLQQQQHIFRQQNTTNTQSGAGSPATGSGLSSLAQQSLVMHNSNISNTGSSNQTLLVCSPATINAIAANNQNNNVTRPTMSLAASLSSTMTFTKFSSLYSSSTTHLLAPNVGIKNNTCRTPSPQPQNIQQQNYQQQQMVAPFPPYKSMHSGGNSSNSLNSATTAPVNSLNHSLTTATNSSYPTENSIRPGNREDNVPSFNKNVWINNNCNNNKNPQPNVSNYGSFYQPNSTTAVNYCVNNGISTSSLSVVNTVYSYSGPPPPPSLSCSETSKSSNLLVSAGSEHGSQQIPKPVVTSHQQNHPHYYHAPSHPPMYMSPGIRNQTSNHTYHCKSPHNVYSNEKLLSPAINFYHQQNIRNVHTSNTVNVPSQPHQMKPNNIGYSMRHSTTASSASQLSPTIQSSQHASYNVPTCTVTGYPNKLPAAIAADIPRYQQSSQSPMSRHE